MTHQKHTTDNPSHFLLQTKNIFIPKKIGYIFTKNVVVLKKFHIREKKHLSIDADSSTDTTVGWTKNTQNPNFFKKKKVIIDCIRLTKITKDR